jgi:Uma2 family endonuclease
MVQSRPSLFIEDDTEDAPWMVMSDWQSHATTNFFILLQQYAAHLSPPLYVAAMLPIRYHPVPGDPRIQQLAPDVLAARVDPHFRSSYRLEKEGVAPAFVLEVVSHESRQRDTVDKRRAYEAMGVQEYLLFDPVGELLTPRMQGYRRERRRLLPWEGESEGRLWSEVLGAWLIMVGEELRLERQDGTLEPSPAEAEARTRAEALARERAEEEVRRLAAELARLRARLAHRDPDEG